MVRDWDDNDFPLAYLISFRTYGTWLHGDERGSMSRKHNKYGTPRIPHNPRLQKAELAQLKHPPVTLDGWQRPVVEAAIREVCQHRGYWLHAISVRTNHAHTVVSASMEPDQSCRHFKLMQLGSYVRNICCLVTSSRGRGMVVPRTCGRRGI